MARIFFFTSVSVVFFAAQPHAAHFDGKRISNDKGISEARQRQTHPQNDFVRLAQPDVWKVGFSRLSKKEGHNRMLVS